MPDEGLADGEAPVKAAAAEPLECADEASGAAAALVGPLLLTSSMLLSRSPLLAAAAEAAEPVDVVPVLPTG